jgi:hypothetical protein
MVVALRSPREAPERPESLWETDYAQNGGTVCTPRIQALRGEIRLAPNSQGFWADLRP